MEFYEVVEARRSVRAYGDDPVEQDKLQRILKAARQAPSAANRQAFKFYVIRDEALRVEMLEAYGQPWLADAPLIVCACTYPGRAWRRSDGKSYADVDLAIAMEHLVLAAAAEGLGTCWIGAFKPDVVCRLLALPDDLEPVAMTPLGYPESLPPASPRKSLDDLVEYR